MSVFKKLFILLVVGASLLATTIPLGAAMTYSITWTPDKTWWRGGGTDRAWNWAKEVEDILEGTTGTTMLYFTPTSADPTGSTEGRVYYDSDDDNLYVRTTAGLVDLTQQTAVGTPAGNDTQIQYNNGGAMGGIASFIWDGTNIELADDIRQALGTDADWLISYEEADEDTLSIQTAKTASTGIDNAMLTIAVDTGNAGMTANQEVFEIGKGAMDDGDANFTELFSVDEDGDVNIAGSLTLGSTFYQTAIAAAASGNANLTVDAAGNGTITVGGTSTGASSFPGNVDIGNAATDTLTITSIIDANVTLDDGATDSPSLILKDATDETATLVKADGGNVTMTPGSASESFQILTGNLKVGNGTEGVALNGNDAYVTGTFEVDGASQLDGSLTVNNDVAVTDQIAVTLGDNAEEIDVNASADNYAADGAIATLRTSGGAGASNNTYLLRLRHAADGDAQDRFLVCEDNAGDDKLAVIAGGTIVSTLDAAAYVQIDADTTANTGTAGVLDMNVKSATANHAAINLDYELDDGGSGTQYGIYIDLDDDAAGGDETFKAIYLANSAGTNATMIGLDAANTVDTVVNAVLGAASRVLVVDAASTINTGTAGIIGINAIMSENGASAMYIDAESEADGAGEIVNGLLVQMDDDADNADNEIRGIHVRGDGVNGSGLQHALVVTGANIDAGLYLQTGYLRVGTGSTPDVALGGADNAFIEGTLEVDGASRFDGAITANSTITGDGGDALGGFLKTVTGDDNGKTLTVAESGTVQTNAGALADAAWTLPAAADGLEYHLIVAAAFQLRVTPGAGDTITINGVTADAAEYWWADAVGESVHLIAIDATKWIAVSHIGTWTQNTP